MPKARTIVYIGMLILVAALLIVACGAPQTAETPDEAPTEAPEAPEEDTPDEAIEESAADSAASPQIETTVEVEAGTAVVVEAGPDVSVISTLQPNRTWTKRDILERGECDSFDSNGNQIITIPEGTEFDEDGMHLFWAIYIDGKATELEQIASKVITVWDIIDGQATCLMQTEFQLSTEDDPNNCAQLNGESIDLEGCYLKITDDGLRQQAREMANILIEPDKFVVSEAAKAVRTYVEGELFGTDYDVGENINVQVHYIAYGNGTHQLFHHEQFFPNPGGADTELEAGAIAVSEQIATTGNKTEAKSIWQVRRNDPGMYDESPYIPVADAGERRYLEARQDLITPGTSKNCRLTNKANSAISEEELQPYFEFFNDSNPASRSIIRPNACDNSLHLFSVESTTIYVGFSPSTPGNPLVGSIFEIFFDPNSPCPGCM